MSLKLQQIWQRVTGLGAGSAPLEIKDNNNHHDSLSSIGGIEPHDPIVAYFQKYPSAVDIDRLDLNSPALTRLRAAGVKLVVPLVSQGEFVGLLNLGPRLSQQEYSADDRSLLNNLAAQISPALRVAQLVQQQQEEALERQQLEHELRIARMIQQSLLPKELPDLNNWEVGTYYQPARAVGGDFYDFIEFNDGRIGILIGDVTDKGIPAAMVMATTRTMLRSIAHRVSEPGIVLERTNNLLCPDIPPNMFVTCLYAVLDPVSGYLQYANAGHNPPFRALKQDVGRLWATGMPLGLMPDMKYEQVETMLSPGERVLFYSDGLVEAHNAAREMYGNQRLTELMQADGHDSAPSAMFIDNLLSSLGEFCGPDWDQEDDITLVSLQRLPVNSPLPNPLNVERIKHNA